MKQAVIICSGDGIGNAVQTTPVIQLLTTRFVVDIFIGLGCSPEIADLLRLPGVRHIYQRTDPITTQYAYQLNTRGEQPKCKAAVVLNSRRSFTNTREAEVYGDLALQLGITDPLPPTRLSV